MCGIVGFSGNFNQKDLSISLDLIAHRGPDDNGTFFCEESCLGLGHRRLSIQDLSTFGHQPMFSSDSNAIVYNGEVYNFKELRTELEAKGYSFNGHSDTEVILNLYSDYGLDMLSMLDGIFAFAIWDNSRKELIIARDGLGVKPLYYNLSDEGFVFASEIKALKPLINFNNFSIDVASLNRYMAFLYCPGEGTPLREVKKVAPGELIIVKHGEIIEKRFFYQLPLAKGRKKSKESFERIVHELDETLRNAVHRQMVSDVPVGAFLSGGLDSSSVVAFASEINPNLKCFTIDVNDKTTDGLTNDLPYAEQVAKHLGVELDIISVDSDKLSKGLEAMVVQLDEPLADPAPLNVGLICQLAKSKNIKVLLSGAGGDDIFTGYRRHLALRSDKYFRLIPQKLLVKFENKIQTIKSNVVFFRRLKKFFNGVSLQKDQRIINYFRWIRSEDLSCLFAKPFRNDLLADYAELPMESYLSPFPQSLSSLDRMLAIDQRFFLADHNLIYTDKMAMAHGVEVRVPLLDDRLMRFVDTIPDHLKLKGFNGKWIFKKTMEAYLPKTVIYRSKTGFGAPLRAWLNCELKDLMEDLLSQKSIENRGIFDFHSVRQLVARSLNFEVDASYTILSLMCIELWCRNFLDKSSHITFQ